MPYLALIDQLNRFIRKKSSFLILSGYSFSDGHLNDTILNALKANPTAMVLGLMHDKYHVEKEEGGGLVERYPDAYNLAKKQHNLNIWTFDKAIIGTNVGHWTMNQNIDDEDQDILNFVKTENGDDGLKSLVELGDFSKFTSFLQKNIGTLSDD